MIRIIIFIIVSLLAIKFMLAISPALLVGGIGYLIYRKIKKHRALSFDKRFKNNFKRNQRGKRSEQVKHPFGKKKFNAEDIPYEEVKDFDFSQKENLKQTRTPKPQPKESDYRDLHEVLSICREEQVPRLNTIEFIVDELIHIQPTLKNRYPQKEITWQTEKIASKYFPELIESYLVLSAPIRFKKKNTFCLSIDNLEYEIKKTRELLDDISEKEFDMKAKEISIRFSNIFE